MGAQEAAVAAIALAAAAWLIRGWVRNAKKGAKCGGGCGCGCKDASGPKEEK